mmetsp:Transcript_5047/g.10012  ORF Transcript_5047/g.10012 Transcript_5047/m.10012 type:complete len:138 (-) Transcript_5047:1280-1693(-)
MNHYEKISYTTHQHDANVSCMKIVGLSAIYCGSIPSSRHFPFLSSSLARTVPFLLQHLHQDMRCTSNNNYWSNTLRVVGQAVGNWIGENVGLAVGALVLGSLLAVMLDLLLVLTSVHPMVPQLDKWMVFDLDYSMRT